MRKVVAAIVAHADDEALGCGGTLARHAAAGDTVHIVFMADGVGARDNAGAPALPELEARQDAARRAAALMGSTPPVFCDFPDNQLDTVALLELAKAVERFAAGAGPDIVYTHHSGDLNIDHRRVCEAVLTAFRPQPGQKVRNIYGFETLSSTEWRFGAGQDSFAPQHYVDITSTLPAKMAALRAYEQEMRSAPHARSYATVEALARYRGGCVGLEAAEAFHVYRQIEV